MNNTTPFVSTRSNSAAWLLRPQSAPPSLRPTAAPLPPVTRSCKIVPVPTLLIAALALTASAHAASTASFVNQVVPILTYSGCNQTACHGSPVGKNGFKLSLFGSDPKADYDVIQKRLAIILKKPSMTVPHGGGQRFKKDSWQYKTLEDWLAAGAPYGDASAPLLDRIEAGPAYRVLRKQNETQPLTVTAIFSDGSREDVTPMSVYTSNDDSVLKVDAKGVASAAGATGDAAVMIRYAGKAAAVVLGATMLPEPQSQTTTNPSEAPGFAVGIIDREVNAKLRQLRIAPSQRSSDEEFLRRAYIDIIGVLPTAGETRVFLSSADPRKREYLVDQLLERSEYADLQTLLWADRLRSDSRFHRVGGVRSYYKWLREEFAANRPLDKMARAMLTATGPNFTNGPANFWGNYDKISTPLEVAIQTGQVFLGIRIGCAQCHNHPFEKWTQADFYSLAAVFSQVTEFHTKNTQEFDLRLDPVRAVIFPVNKQAAPPRYFGGDVIDAEPGEDRRIKFAEWLTKKDNRFFARAMANLIWRNMMGRGIVNPVDDARDTNPPTHPKLLDALARELADHNFDQRHLIRLIAKSDAYQRASAANESNALDFKYYSRAFPKRLLAEVYRDAVAQVTGVPDTFKDWPEAKRVTQLPDNRYNMYFLEVFQRNNRLVICDREENVTTSQGLNFINGPDVQSKLAHADGRLTQLLDRGSSDAELLEDLFLATLARKPTPREKDSMLTRVGAAKSKREIYEDILWALISSKEFVFNH